MVDSNPAKLPGSGTCLLVEDDVDMSAMITDLLRKKNLSVTGVSGLVPAVKALAQNKFSLCLLDMHLSDGHGLQLLEHLRNQNPRVPVIIVTAYGDTPTAVHALKQGADNFIDKPINTDLLYQAIDDALDADAQTSSGTAVLPLPLTGNSRAVMELRKHCLQWRHNRMMVCLSGEPGSGRHLLADFFHQHGAPANSQIISSADLSDKTSQSLWHSFLEALLPPNEQSDATSIGTVVIDDIADIPASVWTLLHRIVKRHHEREPKPGEARLVLLRRPAPKAPASNLPPSAKNTLEILKPYHLLVPSLKERLDDGEALMSAILAHHNRIEQPIHLRYTPKTQRWLTEFASTGNLMMLDEYLRQFIHNWPSNTTTNREFSVPDLGEQDFELLSTLERFRWNRTRAAKFLGLSLRQIRYRLSKIKTR